MNGMLAPILLTAVLHAGTGQEAALEITEPRPTYGHLGATRPKGKGILPGDVAHFSFSVKNLKNDEKGRASYSIAIEVYDPSGTLFYKQEPYNSIAQNFLGGNELPCAASVEIPLNAKPGTYSWKVTITDRLTGKNQSLNGSGKVLPADFGLIRVGTYADAKGEVPIHPTAVVGSTIYLNFAAVGFGRDKKNQPDLSVEMKILDENGKPTTPQPIKGNIKNFDESARIIPLQHAITLNRTGRYTIELSARCELCGKSSSVTIPVRVVSIEQ
ncbi:MAG: hypothetical protein NZO58_10950 [Gemmataceae bacterium]|nr:hypothetical protein [Gemmataceae bacterium]